MPQARVMTRLRVGRTTPHAGVMTLHAGVITSQGSL